MMSSLHEVIYQVVLNPQLLVELIRSPQEFGETFCLDRGEVQALVAISSNNNLQPFLTAETLKSTMQDVLENVWVPPTYP
jgi:hypothetical protein